jgi:hypothetical protein
MQAVPGTEGLNHVDAMKTEIRPCPPTPLARRRSIVMKAKIGRVITRPYLPSGEGRLRKIIKRVLSLDENEAVTLLESVLQDFSHRHRYFREGLERNFELVAHLVPDVDQFRS